MMVADEVVFAVKKFLDQGRGAKFFVGPVENQPLVEAGDFVHMLGDDAEIMRDQHDRQTLLLVQVSQHFIKPGLRFRIHARRGFVEKKDIRTIDDRPGDENPLLLSPREFSDPPAFQLLQFHRCQSPVDGRFIPLRDEAGKPLLGKETHGDDFANGSRKIGIPVGRILGYVANALPFGKAVDLFPHEKNTAAIGLEDAQDNSNECRLSRPIGSDERQKITGGHGKGYLPEDMDSIVVERNFFHLDEKVIWTHNLTLAGGFRGLTS